MFKRWRDVINEVNFIDIDDNIFAIIGIKNQTKVEYNMIFRNMLYDSLNYYNQFENKARGEKIKLVITIVLYWGEKSWTPKITLKDYLQDNPLTPLVSDYRMHLVSIKDLSTKEKDILLSSNSEICNMLLAMNMIYNNHKDGYDSFYY